MGVLLGMTRRRWVMLGVAVLAVPVLLLTEPWLAFIDVDVSEPVPEGATPLRHGELVSLEHESSGTVQVLEAPGGRRWLRFDPLLTSNGPDVVVMLSPKKVDGWSGYDADGHVVLGALKGNRGAQNYELPAGVDLSKYASAVIWCDRFDVGFAAASL